MNAETHANAHIRIANLERKIFWRNVLSFLMCILPPSMLGASAYWVMNTGWMTIFFAGIFALIGFTFWLTGNYDSAANFLFGDEFRIQSERFLEIKKAEIREEDRKKREVREIQEAKIIAALEADMQITGILKDPTKEIP